MKMKSLDIIKIVFFCLFPFISSCREEMGEDPAHNAPVSDEISFDLEFATRAQGAEGLDLEDPEKYFEDGVSCVLISQRSGSVSLNFNENSSNCYKYIYYKNEAANWDSEYNFKSQRPLGWEKIKYNGQYGNGFGFGALFFPKGYTYTEKINADQSDPNEFQESDVLGSWHSTDNIGDRLRFRLYHLMCKLQIDLYLPVWDEETATGFNAGAVKDATTIGFRTDYAIEWGERSTEMPPYAKPSESADGEKIDIRMYRSSYDEDNVKVIDLTPYDIKEQQTDKVRKVSFEVLFPEQTVTGDFLRFKIARGAIEYNYVFNSANLRQNGIDFAIKAGEVTKLSLYMPRNDNDLVLIEAQLLKWNESKASFTITPD